MKHDKISPYINILIDKMFVTTADHDYLLARIAFFGKMDIGFLWNSLHSLEKYFKAILLYNGRTSKGYGHDIVKLYNDVRKIHKSLEIEEFPDDINLTMFGINYNFDRFLEEINTIGSANNRYMMYGYLTHTDFLMKLDYLVFYFRRFCQENVPYDKDAIYPDLYGEISNRFLYVKLGNSSPLDNLIINKDPPFLYDAFRQMNFAFFGKNTDENTSIRISANHSSIYDCIHNLKSEDEEIKNDSAKLLKWVNDNISLSSDDRKKINDALRNIEL